MPWIIDKDLLTEAGTKPGTNMNAIGVCGPRSYKGNGTELTHQFRLLDDDRVVYYEGRSHDSTTEAAFGPLDNFGKPNAGCTIIQYWTNKDWQDL